MLGDESEEEKEDDLKLAVISPEALQAMGVDSTQELPELVAMWHPDINLGIIQPGSLPFVKQQPAVRQWMLLEATDRRDESDINGWYCE